MNTRNISKDSLIKVSLPGESPWAQVVEVYDNTFKARIDNKTVAERSEFERRSISKAFTGDSRPLPKLHDYKYNDIVEFTKIEGMWQPVREKKDVKG